MIKSLQQAHSSLLPHNWNLGFFKALGLLIFLGCLSTLQAREITQLRRELRRAIMADDRLPILQELSAAYLEVNRDSAHYYAEQSLIIAEDLADAPGQARALYLMGRVLGGQGKLAEADSLHRLSLGHYLSMGELFGQADNFYALGELYAQQNLQDSAELYFDKALSYYDDSGDPGRAIDVHIQYGYLLLQWDQAEAALKEADYAEVTASDKADRKRKADALSLAGDVYRSLEKPKKALKEYQKALDIYEGRRLTEQVARSLKCLGLVHRDMGNPAEALDFANRGLDKAHAAGSRSEAMDLYKLLSDLSADQEDFEKAYDYGRLHDLLRDSLLGDAAASDLASIVTKYEKDKLQLENEKAAQKIQLQETEIALSKEQLSLERTRKLAMLGGVGLLFLIGVILVVANIQRKKANRRLAEALENLKKTQNQLVRSEKLASLGQVTAGIAHEIRNPLNFVNNLSQLSVSMVDELGEELEEIEGQPFAGESADLVLEYFADLKANSGKINHHGRRASQIVKDMLAHASSGQQSKSPTDLNGLAREYLNLAYASYRNRKAGFNCQIDFEPDPAVGEVEVVSGDLGRSLLNLFSNALEAIGQKYPLGEQPPRGRIRVTTHRAGGAVQVKVHDNGTGIEPAVQAKIFDPFFTTKPPNEGTGLGLSLAHETIVQVHGGSLKVDSVPGEWTEFTLTLPG